MQKQVTSGAVTYGTVKTAELLSSVGSRRGVGAVGKRGGRSLWVVGQGGRAVGRGSRAVGGDRWAVGRVSWAVGRAGWAVGRAGWAVGLAGWAVGRASGAVGLASWAVGRASWAVGRASWAVWARRGVGQTLRIGLGNESVAVMSGLTGTRDEQDISVENTITFWFRNEPNILYFVFESFVSNSMDFERFCYLYQ
jgi:hypothetical protein